jgi:hypothetical protein
MIAELIEKYGSNVRTQSIEVEVNATSGRFFFPDDSILRNKEILAIMAYDGSYDNATPGGPPNAPSGRTLVAVEGYRNSYVTLKFNNLDMINQHPIKDLVVTRDDKTIREIQITNFTPSKSFVEFNGSGNLTPGTVFYFVFVYLA